MAKLKWTSKKNERRCSLILKDISFSITEEESIELQTLQREMRDYVNIKAPLPKIELKCEDSGKTKENVKVVNCPYDEEVRRIYTPVLLCRTCYSNRCEDV